MANFKEIKANFKRERLKFYMIFLIKKKYIVLSVDHNCHNVCPKFLFLSAQKVRFEWKQM
jgi:hypothetical protein